MMFMIGFIVGFIIAMLIAHLSSIQIEEFLENEARGFRTLE